MDENPPAPSDLSALRGHVRPRHRAPRREVLSIKPDREDVLSRGHICPKAVALKDIHEDPDRLRRPLRRTATRVVGDLVDGGVRRGRATHGAVRARHGQDAVAIYAGNPIVHNLGAMLGIGDFIRAVRTRNLYSATSVDQLPHMVASQMMFGHQFLIPVPDVDRTRLFVCIGGNPGRLRRLDHGGAGVRAARRGARAHGAGDSSSSIRGEPSRPTIADEYLPIRPGTDVFLLLALLQAKCSR